MVDAARGRGEEREADQWPVFSDRVLTDKPCRAGHHLRLILAAEDRARAHVERTDHRRRDVPPACSNDQPH